MFTAFIIVSFHFHYPIIGTAKIPIVFALFVANLGIAAVDSKCVFHKNEPVLL